MDDSAKRRNFLAGLLLLGVFPFFVNGLVNARIYTMPALYWAFEFCCWLLLPAAVFWLAVRKGGFSWQELGVSSTMTYDRDVYHVVLRVLLVPPLAWFYYRVIEALASLFLAAPGIFDYMQALPDDPVLRVLVKLYFALSAGIVEELYYRGLLFRVCQYAAWPKVTFLFLSTVGFGLVHWEAGLDDVVGAAMIGLLFGWLYVRWRNLVPLMVAHAFIDWMVYRRYH